MNKFFEWFGRNRKTIGYVIGILNLATGVNDLLLGNISNGAMFLLLGVVIALDAKMYKETE
jgi:hypothetical protein